MSHPDAGKTTLTENRVTVCRCHSYRRKCQRRKASRHATDWMKLKSSGHFCRQLSHADGVPRLCDQFAGYSRHQDFSEDTYRVLTAADAALMVIDAANGVESQTLRLPGMSRPQYLIITFVNKLIGKYANHSI
ncbi:MAG: GTP-binding protein [Nitrosomonas sp.]|nr:GTP-binding protein [Nitrosomonas sp.]